MSRVWVDRTLLEAAVADGLHLVCLELQPIDVACAWPVFRGGAYGIEPLFVKVTTPEAARRTLSFLRRAAGCEFLPRPLTDEPIPFNELAVVCLEWKEGVRVNAEDMTDAQLASFAAGCRRLSEELAKAVDVTPPDDDQPERQYDELMCYALRHPLAGRLLRPLLEVPAEERTYGGRTLATIHGDLQPKNYAFAGDRLSAVFDTDDLTQGLACEDAAYAFTERCRRAELSSAQRAGLAERFLRLVALLPWPKSDWLVAVNHARLRIAARRLRNHPDSFFVAFDIARRDRPLRTLVAALKEEHA